MGEEAKAGGDKNTVKTVGSSFLSLLLRQIDVAGVLAFSTNILDSVTDAIAQCANHISRFTIYGGGGS